MEKFSSDTAIKILKAIGKSPGETLSDLEAEELGRHHENVLTDLSNLAPKELEAYLTINSCQSYDHLAKLILGREKKNLSGEKYRKFLVRLRTRAHRAKGKIIDRLTEIYETGT